MEFSRKRKSLESKRNTQTVSINKDLHTEEMKDVLVIENVRPFK